MAITDICIYFIIAILGLAYPVSLQVISRLDEKYSSKNIIGLFKKEPFWGIFEISLFSTLAIIFFRIVIKILISTPNAPVEKAYHWADWLLIILTVIVLVFFILYTKKVFVYYTPNRLAQYLRAKKDNDSHDYFNSMADLMHMSIRTEDDGIARTTSNYIYDRFKSYRTQAGDNPVRYPDAYYDFAYRAVANTSNIKSRIMRFLAYNAASGRYFLGELSYTNIHEHTYSWMWINNGVLVENEADDYILEFWKNSHQFISTSLSGIPFRTDPETLDIINKEEIDNREAERDKFYEFHYSLGGMLLYYKRYDALRRIFDYSTSSPPSYELLPGTFTTIFNMFFRLWHYYGWDFPYTFPKAEGVHGQSLSKSWVGRFLALLFIRQYSLVSYWHGYNPLAPPSLPNTQAERKVWLDNLTSFRVFVQAILENNELMDAVGFSHMTPEWFVEQGAVPPLQLVDNTIVLLDAQIVEEEVQQEPAAGKIDEFLTKSSSIISARITSYKPAFNSAEITANFQSIAIRGKAMIYDKAAFANDQGITHVNYDTFMASGLANDITYRLTHAFYTMLTTSFLLRDDEVLQAIDRLSINTEDHVILNFGLDLENLKAKTKTVELTPQQYNGIEIRSVEYVDRRVLGNSLVVIRKDHLPQLEYGTVPQETIEKFGLVPINTGINLYGAVVDLNAKPEIKDILPKGEADLDKSVLLRLDINWELRWKNNAKLVEIKRFSEFFERGVPNKLDEVTPF